MNRFTVAQPFRFLQALLASVSLGALLASGVSAQAQVPQQGKDYDIITPAQPVEAPGKVEVIEFFAYWCPHCNEFDPALNQWIKAQGPDVVVHHIPWAYMDDQVPLMRLYYALDALDKESALRSKVFAAIHVEHKRLNNQDNIADFAAANGIDRKQFLDVYNSFSVQSKVARARQLADAYGVTGVPTMIYGGKYRSNGHASALGLLDFLVGKVRSEMPPPPAPVKAETKSAKPAKAEAKKKADAKTAQ